MLPCGYAYLDGNDAEQDYHLHIIASDPHHEGFVVVVSVSTMYRFADKTVILRPSEHPWLRHESFVAYNFARLERLAVIEARLRRLPTMIRDQCSDRLIRRIQVGLLESEQTENGVKHFFREVHPNG